MSALSTTNRRGKGYQLGLFLFVPLGLLAFGIAVILPWYNWNLLKTAGVLTQGRVVSNYYSSSEEDSSYNITYQYTINNLYYSLHIESREQFKETILVRILYNPENPSLAMLADSSPPSIPMTLLLLAFDALLLGRFFVWVIRSNRTRFLKAIS